MILEGHAREEERRLILDGTWPYFPMLPVKRDRPDRSGHTELGVLVWRYVPSGRERTDGPWIIFLGNMFSMVNQARGQYGSRISWAQAMEFAAGKMEYATLDDVFDDGWYGD